MTQTGQQFDMNPETFTLQNVFAMELHNYADVIGNIVNCAIKELAIEKVCSVLSPCGSTRHRVGYLEKFVLVKVN